MAILGFTGHILTELLGKTDKWRQIYKQTNSTSYLSNDVCLKNNVLRRNNISHKVDNVFLTLH